MTTAQRRIDWVKRWLPFVNQITAGTGILPGLVVSVAILESSKNGVPAASALALKPNYNLFGITAGSNWNGPTVNMSDAGNPRVFRRYANQNESFKDFVKLLDTTNRYKNVDDVNTVYLQAKAMNDAGYSETKDYPERVQAVWETLQGNYNEVKQGAQEKQSGTGYILGGGALLLAALFLNNKK